MIYLSSPDSSKVEGASRLRLRSLPKAEHQRRSVARARPESMERARRWVVFPRFRRPAAGRGSTCASGRVTSWNVGAHC
jgi:hypothetical protein